MNREYLKKYAEFAVCSGSNVQKGQTLIIRAPIEGAAFARLCAEAAYDAGVREVVVQYADENLSRLKMQRTDVEVLEDVKPWILRSYMDYYENEGGVCLLAIMARNPEIYKGIDSAKINRANQALSKAMRPWSDLSMANKVQWSIVAIPSEPWASRVYPDVPVEQAVEKLWENIFAVSRVQGGEPVAAWKKHVASLQGYTEWLNGLDLDSLHFTASNGTDVEIGLADGHIWEGGGDVSQAGVPFLANIPTEEVFTAPDCRRTNGVVKTSLPYVYNGNLIEGISVRFVDGKVVEYAAEKGGDLLGQMMQVDAGATRIGEVALVPNSSPIRQTGVLFYNTLFDENAACHIAFGAGYPGTIQGGREMSREQLLEKGVNDSLIHEDVMIGTPDMNITGKTKAGETVEIFKNGEWAR